ncbi:MAG: hypothetical protein AAF702_46870, partial [Chloroflexota bacterium]
MIQINRRSFLKQLSIHALTVTVFTNLIGIPGHNTVDAAAPLSSAYGSGSYGSGTYGHLSFPQRRQLNVSITRSSG